MIAEILIEIMIITFSNLASENDFEFDSEYFDEYIFVKTSLNF